MQSAFRTLFAVAGMVAGLAHGAVYTPFGGEYASWPSSWSGLLKDSNADYTAVQNLNLVGDAGVTSAGYAVSWAQDTDYIYFRLQLQPNNITPGVFDNDSVILYVNNAGDFRPDWSFAWDHHTTSDGVSDEKHGMELQRYSSGGGANWGDVRMADIDADPAVKGPTDFQATGGDAYLRFSSDLGPGSFSLVDFAISKLKIAASTTNQLQGGQTWNIAVGTLRTGNDHSAPSADICFGTTPGSTAIADGWSSGVVITPVPEIPVSPGWVLGCAFAGVAGRRLLAALRRRIRHTKS